MLSKLHPMCSLSDYSSLENNILADISNRWDQNSIYSTNKTYKISEKWYICQTVARKRKDIFQNGFCLRLSYGFCIILAINNMQEVSWLLHRAHAVKSIFKDTF